MRRDVIVLLSGGIDSITVAKLAHCQYRLGGAVFVRYGQPAQDAEQAAATAWCAAHDVGLTVFDVSGLPRGEMDAAPGEAGPRVVPARNAIFASLAASEAVRRGARWVWIGAIADDHADYPDCRPAWIAAMSAALEQSVGVKLAAPFNHLTKVDVLGAARRLGVDTATAWSCYAPRDGAPCGACNSCRGRIAALDAEAGDGN